MDTFVWLETWYKPNCNGYWEHTCGIKIDTLDHPGWVVTIDLTGTEEEGKELLIKNEEVDEDWYTISSDGFVCKAYGDFGKLTFLLSKFREFVESVM